MVKQLQVEWGKNRRFSNENRSFLSEFARFCHDFVRPCTIQDCNFRAALHFPNPPDEEAALRRPSRTMGKGRKAAARNSVGVALTANCCNFGLC
jgi:hypothetical protein